MNKVPAGLQHLSVVGAVALAHAAGLWALLDHAWQPAAQAAAAPVTLVSLLSEPAAARPPTLLRAPPPVLPEPPRVAPPPLPLSPPVPPPPPVPAISAVPAPAAQPISSERPLPSSETSSAAITAAAPSSAEHKALVPVARPAAAPGLPRQIEQVDYLRAPVLEYPSASRRYGEQGRVVLRVLIGRDGQAEKVELHEPSAFPRLNDAAIEAARRALFKPYTEDGVAQPAWALVALSFQLRR